MKEGQTQDPVKWISAENNPPKNGYYICWCKDNDKGLIHFHEDTGWQNGFYDELVTHWMYLIPPDQFTTPPSPVGIEVEALAKEIASAAWKSAANAYRMYPNNKHTFTDYWNDLGQRAFKAGYSASLPQSSTEEEKDLTTAFIPCDEYDERIVGQFNSINNTSLCYVREITLPVTGESEAIGFGSWIGEEEWHWEIDDLFGERWFKNEQESKYLTTSELYNLYKQSKK